MPRRRSRPRSARPSLPRFAKSSYARRLCAERLEDRRMLATLVVQNNLDGDLATLAGDGELSLREAIHVANTGATIDGFSSADVADTIEFDPAAFTGGAASLVRLTAGELEITDTLTIDGSTGGGVTITGDANGDDVVDASFITDVAASFGDTPGAADDLLDDNSRVLNVTPGFDFPIVSIDLTLEEITITGGRTRQEGGGIRHSSSGSLSLSRTSVTGNSTSGSGSGGGGIYARGGAVTLTGSTVSGNSTSGDFAEGGGISNPTGSVTLTNSTVSGNSTSGFNSEGGGVFTRSGDVTLISSTITGNSSGLSSGGGVYVRGAFFTDPLLTIHNSIVAGNTGGSAPDLRPVSGSRLAVQFSLIGDTTGSGIDEATFLFFVEPFIGNLLNIDPLLGPLADNGGPTLTHAPLLNSPAIDAGNSTLATDQRGQARPVDLISLPNGAGAGSDIGSVEASAPASARVVVPDSVTVAPEVPTPIDPFRIRVVEEGGSPLTVTLTASDGVFSPPADGSAIGAGVTASQQTPQSVTLTGSALDLNAYFAIPRAILYTSAAGVAGDSAATLTVRIDSGAVGTFAVDVNEPLLVTTAADTTDPLDGLTSLREAIIQANNKPGGEVIRFDPTVFTGGAASLIRLNGSELEITDTLTIDGSTGVDVTITGDADGDDSLIGATLPLDDNSRVFHFTSDRGDFGLVGITVTGGYAGGPFIPIRGGAGIRFLSDGLLQLSDSVVSGNRADAFSEYGGGGILTLAGDVSLYRTTVANNSSQGVGGGIATDTGDVTLLESNIDRNSGLQGGGIATNSGAITITSSVVSENGSPAAGGGIFSVSGPVTLIASESHSNFSGSGGGAISSDAGAVTLVDSLVNRNLAGNGGGIYTDSGPVIITRSTISNNKLSAFPSQDEGTVRRGAGVSTNSGDVTVSGSTISGNSTEIGSGGGLYTLHGNLLITDSTVANNSALQGSGGLLVGAQGTASVTIRNSIIAANTTAPSTTDALPGADLKAPPTATLEIDYSLIGDTTNSGVTAGTGTGNLLNENPLIGPLADNGGPTQTHALLPGSPAINAGDPSLTGVDQRSFARNVGGVDIGAYEAQGVVTAAPGDYNRDGVVNTADYAVWRDALDPTTPVTPLTGADGDGDGFVTRRDRDVWLSHVGFAFIPPAPSPIVAELAAEAPPLQQPAFLEPEPVATPAEPSSLATIDSAFALLSPAIAPQASPAPAAAQALVAAPVQDDNLLLLEFGVPGGLADESDNVFADDKPEEEPADDEALAVALGAFE